MATDSSDGRGQSETTSDDELTEFRSHLNRLKQTGCTILVVGDAPRRLFTRTSAQLLGDDDTVRYRLVAATDATIESIVERLPAAEQLPCPLADTVHILNHAGAPRSMTAASNPDAPPSFADVRETRIADPELAGLQSALIDGIEEFARGTDLRPADLRVGVDSLKPLVDHYGEDVVRRCLRIVGGHVRDHDAMAHYVLPGAYESDRVQALVDEVDLVIEVRGVNPNEYDHGAQQRWRVPSRDLTMDWTPL
ncbi:DUF7504 family protein [Halorussus amylolyticus]|uniref:DUF7504 family protein n=1 Tax=Halorussus amylolyticus TaxID=1126242 RepID=UPI00104A8CBE|nr:hypothetical protein [Halorussus amylolyticus]